MDSASAERTTRKSKKRSRATSEEVERPIGRGTSDIGREPAEDSGISEDGGGRESTVENTDATLTARAVLNAIGLEFNELSEASQNDAWKMYRRRLMENFGILSEVMSAKDITELCMKIDENLRQKSDGQGGSPLDEARRFLDSPQVH